jgi:hypothetical protein
VRGILSAVTLEELLKAHELDVDGARDTLAWARERARELVSEIEPGSELLEYLTPDQAASARETPAREPAAAPATEPAATVEARPSAELTATVEAEPAATVEARPASPTPQNVQRERSGEVVVGSSVEDDTLEIDDDIEMLDDDDLEEIIEDEEVDVDVDEEPDLMALAVETEGADGSAEGSTDDAAVDALLASLQSDD